MTELAAKTLFLGQCGVLLGTIVFMILMVTGQIDRLIEWFDKFGRRRR
jgi:hypothetical protein